MSIPDSEIIDQTEAELLNIGSGNVSDTENRKPSPSSSLLSTHEED